ncbi:Bug family tripartite tricarboxylate transporter substrate binding protein [Belnapia rosea]|uniref:Tripartite-type tricarboxylate transporter, receptor component TctC n=1 Tax=Belnapia rosea TaxID=938405 RepID=A0A1G6KC22_9PROT|nr:tripartite tricarboxylate transporter substrate binding protein [Belnapia rosea]SDC28622.1 Tripartite-type tricarboxylate transporter, receptor component TctC [Belnapia rosea]
MRKRQVLAALLGMPFVRPARAQDGFPSRPLRFIVPFAAGGPSDIVARIVAPHMAATLGQPVIIENRPGGGGMTGVDVVAKAAPDGYTFGIGSAGALAIAPKLGRGTPYDPLRDLAPVTLGVLVPEPLVVPASSPYRSLGELIADAKARPGALNFGTTGNGSMPHLAGEQFRAAAGLDIVQIAYNSGGQLATAILRNEVQLGFADLPVLIPQIQAGAMRALAVGTKERLSWIPDVPTFAELGLPTVDASNWHGLFAPVRMPDGPLAAIRRAAIAALQDEEVRRRLHDQGAIPGGGSAEEFGAFMRSESEKWGEVIRRNNIQPD